MHEYSIASAMMQRIEQEAEAHQATRVKSVRVRIGELAGLEVELFRTAYDIVSRDTVCDGAPLEVAVVPVQWACPQCHAPAPAGGRLVCASCGVPLRLVSGDEIMLDRIELEVA
ncbi:MAG TPA: hydrogenase maturation nickel metallochaperone HypA [Gemmatimonadaceae bacterium]|jgi:hydrogenase nickel incorporation protein HypA/HybF|nr:hydrogenase maturation nickel metallochaperone HypA [Gemmatimonadaceae bacterium]